MAQDDDLADRVSLRSSQRSRNSRWLKRRIANFNASPQKRIEKLLSLFFHTNLLAPPTLSMSSP
jgi:hypothetical protein